MATSVFSNRAELSSIQYFKRNKVCNHAPSLNMETGFFVKRDDFSSLACSIKSPANSRNLSRKSLNCARLFN